METIIPLAAPARESLDLAPLASWVLANTAPGLWAAGPLPGEDDADAAARLAAARDIARDLLLGVVVETDEAAPRVVAA